MGDKIQIETKGTDIVSVEYTDKDGKKAELDNVQFVSTSRSATREGSADRVQITLIPDELEWEVELGGKGEPKSAG